MTHRKRFLDIINYLRTNELPNFDFSCTSSCVLHYLPDIFPDNEEANDDIEKYLDIDNKEFNLLFCPDWSNIGITGALKPTATKEEVATHFEKFMNKKYLNQ